MRKIMSKFMMNAEKWQATRSKGLGPYVFRTGLRHIGLEAGFVFILLKYLADLWPHVSAFSMRHFLLDYAVWWPAFMVLGMLAAPLIWVQFESKYGK